MSNNHYFVIGIEGKAGAGKDTLADLLLAHIQEVASPKTRSFKYSMAKPLKDTCALLFDMTDEEMNTLEGKKKIARYGYGRTNREILQIVGTECFRNNISQTFWTDLCQRFCETVHEANRVIVIPDIRFKEEAEFVKKNGVLIKIIRPEQETIAESAHSSEAGSGVEPDLTFVNESGLSELGKGASQVISSLIDTSKKFKQVLQGVFSTGYVYVTTQWDYADEFYVEGAFVAEKERFEKEAEWIEKVISEKYSDKTLEVNFGTNEALYFGKHTDPNKFKDGLKVATCTKEFCEEFISLNGGPSSGMDMYGIILENLLDEYYDEYPFKD